MNLINKVYLVLFSLLLVPYLAMSQGFHGYLGSRSNALPAGYNMGLGFYSAVWSLTPEPIRFFQVGLPSTWITPNNSDNTTLPLCPIGTMARDNWPERGPTYESVFQTIEGGLGYWSGNRFHYGPPKYSMNSTPDCYSSQIASPGWTFFLQTRPLPDDMLGIAQLSNRILIPPDGMPFKGAPNGEFLGFSYIALPLSEPHLLPQPTGNNNWTMFLNSKNFKGPVAYFVPETWSKISKNHPFASGRGLDSKETNNGNGGTMEIAAVPYFSEKDSNNITYTKIAPLQFPVDSNGNSTLVRDLAYYSKNALYNDIESWKNGGNIPAGSFNKNGIAFPSIWTHSVDYTQEGKQIVGVNEVMTPFVFPDSAFGLKWSGNYANGYGKLPQYYKEIGGKRVAIQESELPEEITLKTKQFEKPFKQTAAYHAELKGAWANPGPSAGPYTAILADNSRVTYYWYKFIDQPVFQQYNFTTEEKNKLQQLVEQMHEQWTISKEYMHPLAKGELVSFDENIIVSPPTGFEKGYVPIVTRQSAFEDIECTNLTIASHITASVSDTNSYKAEIQLSAFSDQAVIKWHNGDLGLSTNLAKDETYLAEINILNCKYFHYSPPVAMPAKGLDNLSFYAFWKEVPGAKSYLIDVSTDVHFNNILSGWDNKQIEGTSIEVPLVNGVNTYFYRLRTKGFSNEISGNSNVIALNIPATDCQLHIQIVKSNLSTAVANNGYAKAIVKGGKTPLTYLWSNGAQTDEISNLSPGKYKLIVTDANQCSDEEEVIIRLPLGSNSIGNRVWNDRNRNGFEDFDEPGIANVNVAIYLDDNGDGIPNAWRGYVKTDVNGYYLFKDLNPGIYSVFVWENGNWGIGDPLYDMINTVGNSDPNNDIDGDDNGQNASEISILNDRNIMSKPIIITADGEPLNDGDRMSVDFDYDPSGNMTVDFGFYECNNSCPIINMQIRGSDSASFSKSNGFLSANTASGRAPFKYIWSNGQTSSDIKNLQPGEFKVIISDANGCRDSAMFTIKESVDVPLPIKLLSFNAIYDEATSSVLLKWETVNETNNDYFTIERSANGKDFEFFSSKKGVGNSNQLLFYEIIDRSPLPNLSYYRLTQTDLNGLQKYSVISSVFVNENTIKYSISPNPASDYISIHPALNIDYIQVVNSLGIPILTSKKSTDISISDLPIGFYFVFIYNNENEVFVNKIIISE